MAKVLPNMAQDIVVPHLLRSGKCSTKIRNGARQTISVFGCMYCKIYPWPDAPTDKGPVVKQTYITREGTRKEDNEYECNVTLATS